MHEAAWPAVSSMAAELKMVERMFDEKWRFGGWRTEGGRPVVGGDGRGMALKKQAERTEEDKLWQRRQCNQSKRGLVPFSFLFCFLVCLGVEARYHPCLVLQEPAGCIVSSYGRVTATHGSWPVAGDECRLAWGNACNGLRSWPTRPLLG